MEADIRTLTDAQKEDIKNWYLYIINDDEKLEKKETKNSVNYEFNKEVEQFTSWYTRYEIDSWHMKIKEAEKVLNWWESVFLMWIIIEWETVEELAQKIMDKANAFKIAYANAEKTKREKLKNI